MQPSVPDDTSLVARCLEGDTTAWEALVRRYQRLVYAIARDAGLDEQTAADVFQTVFLRLLQQLPRINQPARLQAWIVTTSKREAWLHSRRSRRMVSMTVTEDAEGSDGTAPDAELLDVADEALQPEETIAHWQLLAQVQRAFERLDERCRRLLQALFSDEDDAYDEVGRRLNMPVGSIGPTRSRCLAKLRRSID